MKLIGRCECCGKEREFEFDKIEFREYDLCGCEKDKNGRWCHRWHNFVIDEKEIFRKFYPELEYKLRR